MPSGTLSNSEMSHPENIIVSSDSRIVEHFANKP